MHSLTPMVAFELWSQERRGGGTEDGTVCIRINTDYDDVLVVARDVSDAALESSLLLLRDLTLYPHVL